MKKIFNQDDILMLAREARESSKNPVVIPDRGPDYAGIISGITAIYDVWIDDNMLGLTARVYDSGIITNRRLRLRPGMTLESALVILKNRDAEYQAEINRQHAADTARND